MSTAAQQPDVFAPRPTDRPHVIAGLERSIVIIHRRSAFGGWDFECAETPAIDGGGSTYSDSVEAATHSARRYLEGRDGHSYGLDEVRQAVHHCATQ